MKLGDKTVGEQKGVGFHRVWLSVVFCIALAAAFILANMDSLKAQTRIVNGRKVPPSANAKISGMFMGWGKAVQVGKPTVAIRFVPKGRSTKALMNTPSITPNSATFSIDPVDLAVARKLKIGEQIEIRYSSRQGWVWMTEIKRLDPPNANGAGAKPQGGDTVMADIPQHALDKFTYVGAKKVRSSAGIRMKVVVRRGSNMWSFEAPFEPAGSAGLAGGLAPEGKKTGAKEPTAVRSADAPLSEQVDAFKGGDIVAVKYETDPGKIDFKFILRSIRPYKMSAKGILTRVGTRVIRGKKHDVAYVKCGKIKMVLVVPLKGANDLGENAAAISSTLQAIGSSEAVFSYHKQAGITWLNDVVAN